MKELKMYIDGRFIENQSDKWIDVLNPSTEEVISKMPDGTPEDARAAINAAVKAQLSWESLTSIERAGYLTRIAQGIRKREQELTDIIIREGGKTRGLANVEVLFTADYLDYMAGWARRYEGEIIPSDRPHENIFVFKKPIGVTTGILPWNFPFFLIARKAAPALLTGNTIVVKPSQLTPENAYVFAQIVDEVGLPKGVFNLVNGRGSVIHQTFLQHLQCCVHSIQSVLHPASIPTTLFHCRLPIQITSNIYKTNRLFFCSTSRPCNSCCT